MKVRKVELKIVEPKKLKRAESKSESAPPVREDRIEVDASPSLFHKAIAQLKERIPNHFIDLSLGDLEVDLLATFSNMEPPKQKQDLYALLSEEDRKGINQSEFEKFQRVLERMRS